MKRSGFTLAKMNELNTQLSCSNNSKAHHILLLFRNSWNQYYQCDKQRRKTRYINDDGLSHPERVSCFYLFAKELNFSNISFAVSLIGFICFQVIIIICSGICTNFNIKYSLWVVRIMKFNFLHCSIFCFWEHKITGEIPEIINTKQLLAYEYIRTYEYLK